MKRALLIATLAPALLFAKGATVRITIEGDGLTTPVETAEAKIGSFHIWSGPGCTRNGVEETEGFIIDWQQGAVAERPKGLQRYEVSFYAGCLVGCPTPLKPPRLAYVVTYEFDPAAGQGYVYLPGTGEKWYRENTGSILRRREGNWFRATAEWDRFAGPLIARARADADATTRDGSPGHPRP